MDQGSLSGMSGEFGGPDSGPGGFMPGPPPGDQQLMSQRGGGGSPEFINSQGKPDFIIIIFWPFVILGFLSDFRAHSILC